MADPGQLWMDIFYGEGRMDVQLTNQIYEQRHGKTGTTVGYTNTPTNPASGPNPSAMSPQAYNSTPVYTNPAGTQQGLPKPITTPAPTVNTQQPTTQTPTQQGVTTPNQQQQPTPTQQGTGDNPQGPSTADLLNRFLESDPDLMLNLTANKFRDMGASNVFMQWFTSNFNQFWGEFLGRIAAQAAAGQVPDMSFVDWVMNMDPQQQAFSQNVQSRGPSGMWQNFVEAQGAA